MANNVTTSEVGLLDTLKEKVNIESWLAKFNITWAVVIELGMYLGIGFVSGFILKKYSTLFFALVAMVVFFLVCQHTGIISVVIDWTKVQELTGMQAPVVVDAEVATNVWQWITLHISLVVGFVIGFFLGLKVA